MFFESSSLTNILLAFIAVINVAMWLTLWRTMERH